MSRLPSEFIHRNVIAVIGGSESEDRWHESVLLKFATAIDVAFKEAQKILRFLVSTAIRKPKPAIAIALLMLAVLAGVMTYTGFLVVGFLADYLGTGRYVAGLLLGVLFARFPWISNGKLRIVGVLPRPVRRPLIVSLLLLCLLHFALLGAYVPVLFTGFTMAFLILFPWLKRTVFDRLQASVFQFAGAKPSRSFDDGVIDGEFREIRNDD